MPTCIVGFNLSRKSPVNIRMKFVAATNALTTLLLQNDKGYWAIVT